MPPLGIGHTLPRLLPLALAACLVAGCATRPPGDDPEAIAEFEQVNDPFEPANRAVFQFNEALDTVAIKPAAQGYRRLVPAFGRDRVGDFLTNLRAPLIFGNEVLQGRLASAATTVGRFAINSTFGVLGIMDVAARMGLSHHEEDFGQTLAVWGIGDGPYLVLPFFGPSNPRDAVGLGVEWLVDPLAVWARGTNNDWLSPTRTGVATIDYREANLELFDEIERSSLDYYSSLRSLYRQRRSSLIVNGTGVQGLAGPGLEPFAGPSGDGDGTQMQQQK